MPDESEPSGWRASPGTAALLLLCGLVFLVTMGVAFVAEPTPDTLVSSLWNLASPQAFERTGGLVLTEVWTEGAWWRVLSAGLVHGSLLHLLLNGWALWSVGQWTEHAWGTRRYLLIFALSSVGGCLASLAWAEAPIVVGASGGIFGIAGGLVVAARFGRPDVRRRVAGVHAGRLALWLAIWLVVGWQLPMLANAGHAGGLVVGCGAALALFAQHRWARISSLGITAVVLIGSVWWGHEPSNRSNYHAFLGFKWLEDGDEAKAGESFQAALAISPDDPVLENAVAYQLALAGEDLGWARELVMQALEQEPDNPDYVDTLGWIDCRAGDTDTGMEALRRAKSLADGPVPEIDGHIEDCATSVDGLPQ